VEAQISAALAGDQEATAQLLRSLDRLIRARARRIDRWYAEDLAQEGREALWRGLSRFTGGTAGQFVIFAERTVTGAMMDAYCAMRYPGISVDEVKLWRSACKRAQGDPEEAERLMCSGQLAWRMRPATAKAVRAAVSPAATLPEDLGTPEPYEAATGPSRGLVGVMLSGLGAKQRAVLEMTYGIGSHGRMSDAEIGASLGMPKGHVAAARSKALKRLRDQWSGSFFFA
jgi:RNA polymerase sigma factor (sigma-70 family)